MKLNFATDMTSRHAAPTEAHRSGARAGSALLVVLPLLGIVAALAVVVARAVSGAAADMNSARVMAQAEADLRGGIELGVAAIQKLGSNMRSAEASVDLPGRRISVWVTNERGRVDLNVANVTTLAGLIGATGIRSADPRLLANSLRDWRSGFETPKAGANAPAPQSGTRRGGPAPVVGQRVLAHPLQLTSVPNFSMEVVTAILPFVTVASGSSQIDPSIASDRVLLALPGTSSERVQAFRNSGGGRDAAIRALGAPQALLTADPAAAWRLQILTTLQNGRQRNAEAVVALLKDDSELYRILYVVDEPMFTRRAF